MRDEDSLSFVSEDAGAPSGGNTLVWLERIRVEPTLYDAPLHVELDWVLGNPTAPIPSLSPPQFATADLVAQLVLETPGAPTTRSLGIQIAHRGGDGALLSVPASVLASLDAGGIPLRFWRYSAFPKAPIPLYPVPEEAKEKLRVALRNIKFDPLVASVVDGISVSHLKSDIRYLTGEAPSSDIESRRTLSEGALRAAKWLGERIEETGARCEFKPFREGWAPNVVWYECSFWCLFRLHLRPN